MKKETIEDLKKRLTSRKLWMTLGAITALILMGITGQFEWAEVGDRVMYLVLAYVGVEGSTDIVRQIKK